MIYIKREHQTIGFNKWVQDNLKNWSENADPTKAGVIGIYNDKNVIVFQTKIHEITLLPLDVLTDLGNGQGAAITIII